MEQQTSEELGNLLYCNQLELLLLCHLHFVSIHFIVALFNSSDIGELGHRCHYFWMASANESGFRH